MQRLRRAQPKPVRELLARYGPLEPGPCEGEVTGRTPLLSRLTRKAHAGNRDFTSTGIEKQIAGMETEIK